MTKYLPFLFFLPTITQAQNIASAVTLRTETFNSGLVSIVLSLFALIIVATLLLWLTRRFLNQKLGIGRWARSMRIVSITMVGPKEKIVVLDNQEGEELTVGVTSQHIHLLTKRRIARNDSQTGV